MKIEVAQQAIAFLWSVAIGGILGGVFDLFRIARILWKHRFFGVFSEDLLFSFIAAAITFFTLARVNDGQPRLLFLLGEGCGFILYLNTVGCLTASVARFISSVLQKIKSLFSAWGRIFIEKKKKYVNFFKKHFIFLFRWCRIVEYNLKGRSAQDGKEQKSKKT